MGHSCKDCQEVKCSQIHGDYDPTTCNVSNGDPCQKCCELATLDNRISQVHAELVALARKRRLLKTKINQRHDPFIHRLPLEISSNIMTTYVDDIDSAFNVHKAKGLEDWSPALHLSSICVLWRSIARCTEQIWRVIRVPLIRNPVNVTLLKEIMMELFTLSGQRTLSLGLYQDYNHNSSEKTDYYVVLKALIRRLRFLNDLFAIPREVTSRFNEITVHGLPLEQIRELFRETKATNLKRFRILSPYGDFCDYHDDFPSEDVCLFTSPLEEVEIASATCRILPSVEIDWDNITTAKMHGISLTNALEILLIAPRLKTYTIYCPEFNPPDDDSLWLDLPLDLPLTHPRLESLELHSSTRISAQFFESVKFPALQELNLDTHIHVYNNCPVNHLISFFKGSPCHLTSLRVSLKDQTLDEDVLNLLYVIPTLTRLSLYVPSLGGSSMSDTFLQELVQPSLQRPKMVVPRLEHFSYTGRRNFTWPAFFKIFDLPEGNSTVQNRPLRDVSLQFRSLDALVIDDGVLSRLREIQATIDLKIVSLVGSGGLPKIIPIV